MRGWGMQEGKILQGRWEKGRGGRECTGRVGVLGGMRGGAQWTEGWRGAGTRMCGCGGCSGNWQGQNSSSEHLNGPGFRV